MEDSQEKKQNNRRDDIKRVPNSKKNAPTKEKEWDPTADNKDDDITNDEKLKALKDVRSPNENDANSNEKNKS